MFITYKFSLGLSVGLAAMLWGAGSASAAIFADFSTARHDRFLVGDPADPDPLNPNFLLDHARITGVGLTQAILITPQHYLTAAHLGVINPTFVSADGTRHTYAAQTFSKTIFQTTLTSDLTLGNGTVLPAGTVRASDLAIVRLVNPISVADGIDPLPLFGGPSSILAGREINMFVQSNQAGGDTADFVATIELNTGAITEGIAYRYDNPPGFPASDELYFTGGDSGRGSITQINGQMVLVGVHMGVGTDTDTGDYYSIDSFVTPYLNQIQAIVARDGFQIAIVGVPESRSLLLMGCVAAIAVLRVRKMIACQ